MPILNPKAPAPAPEKNLGHAVAPEIQSNVVDTRYQPHKSLLAYVEGASWIVNYYSQILGKDDEVSDLQVNQEAAYQQYRLVKLLELKVTGELSQSQDATTRTWEVTGEATVYAGVIPNVGDVFIADIGDGKEGLFTVTASEKKSRLHDAVYTISYKMRSEMDDLHRRDLDSKVVVEQVFVRNTLQTNRNATLVTTEFEQLAKIEAGYKNLVMHYFRDFFNIEHQTLLVPDQPEKLYDPFLVSGVLSTVDQSEHPLIYRIKVLNVERDPAFKEVNLWQCLAQNNVDLLTMAFYQAGVAPRERFNEHPQFNGFYYSGIESIVYPTDKANLKVVDSTRSDRTDYQGLNYGCEYVDPLVPERIVGGSRRSNNLNKILQASANLAGFEKGSGSEPVLIHPVTIDDFYVLSRAFYYQEQGQSVLELATRNTLEGKPVDKADLLRLVESAKTWPNLERFYYIPLVLILIKYAMADY